VTATETPARRRTTLGDLFHERANFEFIDRSWRWVALSGTLVLIAIVALSARGLNLGIDFTGGLSYTVNVKGHAPSVNSVRSVLSSIGEGDAKISLQSNQSNGQQSIVVQTPSVSTAKKDQIAGALARYGPVAGVVDVSPTWGSTVTRKAAVALGVFFVLIAVYLSFRFEWRMAAAAILAVIHDILVTTGVYAVTGFQVVPATVIAFLTILGFSLYDTVVVFDKVIENTPSVGTDQLPTYSRMVNRSLNQVLMRSLNTSLVAVLPVASLVFVGSGVFGATALKDFALALFVGLATGAYSSIFVASPLLAWIKEREPRYRAVRERATSQLARRAREVAAPVPAPTREVAPAPVGSAPAGDRAPTTTGGGTTAPVSPSRPEPPISRPSGVTPRARQQRRRKRR
jgi:preprotein translocase subunit SecF